jgi:tetratricopeptide (TPR) repeat protein
MSQMLGASPEATHAAASGGSASDPIQETQAIVRTLRMAAGNRVAAEASVAEQLKSSRDSAHSELRSGEARARHLLESTVKEADETAKRERSAAEETASRTLKDLDSEIGAVRDASKAAEHLLNDRGLPMLRTLSTCLAKSGPNGVKAEHDGDPAAVLTWHSQSVQHATAQLQLTVARLRQSLAAQQAWRRRLVTLSIVVSVVLLVGAVYGPALWKLENTYRQATDLLAAGNWTEARALFQTLAPAKGPISIVYRDSDRQLRETYYRAAEAALHAGQYKRSREELTDLAVLDSSYRDSRTLYLESHYRPAAAALEAARWDEARIELQHLLALDPAYKDAQMLYRESHYRSAVRLLADGHWPQARAELEQLKVLDSSYKDIATLLRESYYRAALAELDARRPEQARQSVEELLRIDSQYRETVDLWWRTFMSDPRELGDCDRVTNEVDLRLAQMTVLRRCLIHPQIAVKMVFYKFLSNDSSSIHSMMRDASYGRQAMNILTRSYSGAGYEYVSSY